jgi:hypothetical protein
MAKKKLKVKDDTNVGWHQVKFDDDAYGKLKHEREHLCKMGRHASYSDAFRDLYTDAMLQRKRLS